MNQQLCVGVMPPLAADPWAGTDLRGLLDFARAVEDLGFDSLWANDSLVRPRIEALTFLSAAAAVTDRITLGTAALQPVLRRPVQTAQVLASIDRLSRGRLAVAVGAGFPGLSEVEYAASEVPWPRRFARLDDTVALWRQLWDTKEASSFHGACAVGESNDPDRAFRSIADLVQSASLARFLPTALAPHKVFDRTSLNLSLWLPRSRSIGGAASAFPTFPIHPLPKDAVCP